MSIPLEKANSDNVSSCDVLSTMCCQPRATNVFWKYFLKPVIAVFCAILVAGALYLYLVPFTNIIGQWLFADFRCYPASNVWGVCGRVNSRHDFDVNGGDVVVDFFVFLIIQSSVGFILLGSYLGLASLRHGRLVGFDCELFCCSCCFTSREIDATPEWRQAQAIDYDEKPKGPCMATHGIWFSVVGILFATLFVGIWGGRAIAVHTVPQCMPFVDTQIGLYGCVSNVDGTYVGDRACTDCAGVGFGILAIPLYVAEILAFDCHMRVQVPCCLSCNKDRVGTA